MDSEFGEGDGDGDDTLVERALGVAAGGQRVILGITGSPGAGKTTLALALVARVNELARKRALGETFSVHLPMDGYHLANATLDHLGIRDRKGAIETFDGGGYVALLRRLLEETNHTVYAPEFDRRVDEGVTGHIAVEPGVRLVVTEGNYLLVDEEPWSQIRQIAAEVWYCDASETERTRRLVDRHTLFGRTPEAAAEWARTVDGTNAILVESTRPRADLKVSGTTRVKPS